MPAGKYKVYSKYTTRMISPEHTKTNIVLLKTILLHVKSRQNKFEVHIIENPQMLHSMIDFKHSSFSCQETIGEGKIFLPDENKEKC